MRAAALRPDLQRDAEGLSELEFVISMCLELKMVDLDMIQPFIDQFHKLDVDGSGRLGSQDLRLQSKMSNIMDQLTLTRLNAANKKAKDRMRLETRATNKRLIARSPTKKNVQSQSPPTKKLRWKGVSAGALRDLSRGSGSARASPTLHTSLRRASAIARVLPSRAKMMPHRDIECGDDERQTGSVSWSMAPIVDVEAQISQPSLEEFKGKTVDGDAMTTDMTRAADTKAVDV